MDAEQRINIIRERLKKTFEPVQLDVIDDSDKHRGHVGSQGGAGHYTVVITAVFFKGKSRITSHREIYQVLADLIPHEIHALQIKLIDL
jgi:BolA family transcriptional regulator, general stress-responsive regulator